MQRKHRRLCTATVALLAGGAATHAEQISWNVLGDGIFQDASNWSPTQVPDVNDLVVLDQPTAGTTISFASDVETLSLELFDGAFTFELGGHTYTLNGGFFSFSLAGPNPTELTTRNGTVRSVAADVFAGGQLSVEAGSTIELGALTVFDGATAVIGDQAVIAAETPIEGGARATIKPGATLRLEPGGALRTRRVFVEKLKQFAGDPFTGHYDQQGGSTRVESSVEVGGVLGVHGGLFVLGGEAPPGVTSGFVQNDPFAALDVVGGRVEVDGDAYFVSGFPKTLDFNDTICVSGSVHVGGFGGAGYELSAKGGIVEVGDRLVVGDGGHVILLASSMAVTDLDVDGGEVTLTGDASILVGADAAPGEGLIVDGPGPANASVRGIVEIIGSAIIGGSPNGQGEVNARGPDTQFDASYWRVGSDDGTSAHAVLTVEDGATVFCSNDVIVNEGAELRLVDGTVSADADVYTRGVLAGAGVIRGSLTNAGIVRPGCSIGLLRLELCGESYSQTVDGAIEIEVAGFDPTEHDRIEVEGPVMLAGALRLALIDGFTPDPSQGFEIIKITDGSGQGLTGTFATVEPAGWDALYLGDRVVVTYEDPCPADIDDSGVVGFADLLLLVAQWGACPASCPWDLDGTGQVGFSDLQLLLQSWGPCGAA